ncbi:hypothetical protein AK830_g11977 [Neonectria ditissima]|uniref:receptor protein-tyrosine kinase n=1 Tax=Neonectria ditissima TaxID=78410 RepID=A0A0P7B6H4_9HYPO|nr:hypothetical protein AK830_g11977 [Neonectria ditissima]
MRPARPERYQAAGLAYAQAMPTAFVELLGEIELAKRADSSTPITVTVTVAPDETCGYLSGEAGAAITCENDGICSWEAQSLNVVGCGDILHSTCYPMSEATDLSSCNDVCQTNTWNLLCTESKRPFCRTYQFPEGVLDYRCASTEVEDVQSVDFTYFGQDDPGFTTTLLSDESQITSMASLPTRPTVTVTGDPSDETHTDTPDPSPKHKTPIGAIIGGAVGGLLVLVLLILGILCLRRRNNKKHKETAAPPPPPTGYPPPDQQAYNQAAVMTPEAKPVMVSSHNPADWRQSTVSPLNAAISPVSQAGWQGHASPAPAYQAPAYETKAPMQETFEAPGHEAREADPIYEMGDERPRK